MIEAAAEKSAEAMAAIASLFEVYRPWVEEENRGFYPPGEYDAADDGLGIGGSVADVDNGHGEPDSYGHLIRLKRTGDEILLRPQLAAGPRHGAGGDPTRPG